MGSIVVGYRIPKTFIPWAKPVCQNVFFVFHKIKSYRFRTT